MPKKLYEEALADVKKVKEVAEENAKRAILEAVTPRIRDFIEQAILESADDGMIEVEPLSLSGTGPMPPRAPSPPLGGGPDAATDIVAVDPLAQVPVDVAGSAAAISPPDSEGKVTLDIDSMCSTQPGVPVPPPMFGAPLPAEDDVEYEVSLESLDVLNPTIRRMSNKELASQIQKINERASLLAKASKAVSSTSTYNAQITQMISRVEDMYDHVQEQVTDPAIQNRFETMLEASFKCLNKLQERTTMSKKTKQSLMNEEDVTLKLTGLPDDIDLDAVGVDLITGDEEGEEGGDELGLDDGMGDQGDLGGQEGAQQQMETRNLSDDTIVEIDENMLRREIARMRSIREDHSATGGSETKAQSWGNGPDHFDSFGGGKDEGEPTDADIVDMSPAPGAKPLGEADQDDLDESDDDLDEADDLDESDEMEEAVDPNGMGGNNNQPTNKQARTPGDSNSVTMEGTKRLAFEQKFQARAKARAKALKVEAAKARAAKNGKRLAEVKKEYAVVAKRYNESVARANKVSQQIKLEEQRSNSAAARSAENGTENAGLRKKLAETNLFNVKLVYANRILQLEGLTSRQKSQVIKQLDGVKTVREAKLVYESLTQTLGGSSKSTVTEGADRKVLGSASRATRPAATSQSLNEGYEAERWAQLAGITKR